MTPPRNRKHIISLSKIYGTWWAAPFKNWCHFSPFCSVLVDFPPGIFSLIHLNTYLIFSPESQRGAIVWKLLEACAKLRIETSTVAKVVLNNGYQHNLLPTASISFLFEMWFSGHVFCDRQCLSTNRIHPDSGQHNPHPYYYWSSLSVPLSSFGYFCQRSHWRGLRPVEYSTKGILNYLLSYLVHASHMVELYGLYVIQISKKAAPIAVGHSPVGVSLIMALLQFPPEDCKPILERYGFIWFRSPSASSFLLNFVF